MYADVTGLFLLFGPPGRQKKRRERESDGNESCRMEKGTKRRKERKCGGLDKENSH